MHHTSNFNRLDSRAKMFSSYSIMVYVQCIHATNLNLSHIYQLFNKEKYRFKRKSQRHLSNCYLPLLFYCFQRKHRYQSRSHYRVIEPNYDRNSCICKLHTQRTYLRVRFQYELYIGRYLKYNVSWNSVCCFLSNDKLAVKGELL